MKHLRTYRMDARALAKLAALRVANPGQHDTELIRVAIDLLFVQGSPLIREPTAEEVGTAYAITEDKVRSCNVLDKSLDLHKDVLNELYLLKDR